jgi:hypothetical protein
MEGYRNALPYKQDWGPTAALVEPPAELMHDVAGSNAIVMDVTTGAMPSSIGKSPLVILLAALLECSSALAMVLGRIMLACYPGLREA